LQRLGEWLKLQGAPGLLDVILPDARLRVSTKIEAAIEELNQTGSVLLIVDNLESVQQDDQRLRDPELLLLLQKLLTNLRGGRVLLTGRYAVKDLLPDGKFAAHLLHLNLDDLSHYETGQLLARHDKLAGLGEFTRETLILEFGGLPYVYDLLNDDAMVQSLDRLLSDIQGRMTQERQQRSAEEWQKIRRQVVEFAALEATVARLAPPSRQLLAQLSVLERPYPLSAIEQGLGAERIAWQPLLDRSLLRYDTQQESYRLHSLTRHYARSLLDEQERTQAQSRLAIWYVQYADQASHDLADYLEAHSLYRAAGALQAAGELCTTTKDDLQQQDVKLTTRALYELGNIASLQGDYAEARRLYQQSLEIDERLGDQRGKANSLGQLGTIAYEQGDLEQALVLIIQAFLLFDALQAPDSATALVNLARIRTRMDEATFMGHWRALAGDRPLPDLPQVDTALVELAAQQEHEGARETIKTHRLLLQRCRQIGIAAAFAEQKVRQDPEGAFLAVLNDLCGQVVTVLHNDEAAQREALATQIEHMLARKLPVEGARAFLNVLIAWLCRQDAQMLERQSKALLPPFRETYEYMVHAVEQGTIPSPEAADSEAASALTIEDLPEVIAALIRQGTEEQKQQFADSLEETQRQLPSEAAPLGSFLGCLTAALRGEIPDIAALEAPFTGLWQAFLDELKMRTNKQEEEKEENDA
jgi:tetratricopeptide (TPR) repeat protein